MTAFAAFIIAVAVYAVTSVANAPTWAALGFSFVSYLVTANSHTVTTITQQHKKGRN
jgi:hypothetical protein